MIGKSKPSKTAKELTSQAKTTIRNTITSKSSSTHNTSIIDSYLIKLIPKSPDLLKKDTKTSIISFDLDGTLVNTKSGAKFPRGSQDWKWFNNKTLSKLQKIQTPIVIFTNQGGVVASKTSKSYVNFHTRAELILKELAENGVNVQNIWIYASPKKPAGYKGDAQQFDKMRKPNTGMFDEFLKDFGTDKIDLDKSYFIGDAAGRKNDFSNSDLEFAKNCKLHFNTPEEYFV